MGYAESLRAIGQALESLNIGDFCIEPGHDGYRISGDSVPEKPAAPTVARSRPAAPDASLAGAAMALSYSLGDVARLDREGRARRDTGHAITDPSRLSQALRVIGSYLNQKYSRMVRLSRRGESFEIQYESSLGSRYCECFTAADLYNLWVRFYLQRAARLVST